MATKKFIVREGFTYTDDGKNYAEGETLDLAEEVGTACHQLEFADAKQRAKAAAAEAEEATRIAAEEEAAKAAQAVANDMAQAIQANAQDVI